MQDPGGNISALVIETSIGPAHIGVQCHVYIVCNHSVTDMLGLRSESGSVRVSGAESYDRFSYQDDILVTRLHRLFGITLIQTYTYFQHTSEMGDGALLRSTVRRTSSWDQVQCEF